MSSSAKRVYRDAVVPRRGRVRAPLPVRWVTSASGHDTVLILILAGVYILIERMFLQHHVLDINQLSVFVEQSKQ